MGFLVGLLVCVGFGSACAAIADAKGRSQVGWFLIGFLFWLLGLILIIVLPSEKPVAAHDPRPWPDRDPLAPPAPSPAPLPPPRFDARRWAALKEVDAEIAAAAARAAALGDGYEDELAEKFLVLDDKAYLPALEGKLAAKAAREREGAEARARDGDRELWATIEAEMARYEALLRESGGRDPAQGRAVAKVEPYTGSWVPFRGGVKATLEDGSVVLRKGGAVRPFGPGEAVD